MHGSGPHHVDPNRSELALEERSTILPKEAGQLHSGEAESCLVRWDVQLSSTHNKSIWNVDPPPSI
jgi:hypothetical protein